MMPPYLTPDCATCRLWVDRHHGTGACRKQSGPSIECTDEGRVCLSHVERTEPDWPSMVRNNEGVRGL